MDKQIRNIRAVGQPLIVVFSVGLLLGGILSAQQVHGALNNQRVVDLVSSGVRTERILRIIADAPQVSFILTPGFEDDLIKAGVSKEVIRAMEARDLGIPSWDVPGPPAPVAAPSDAHPAPFPPIVPPPPSVPARGPVPNSPSNHPPAQPAPFPPIVPPPPSVPARGPAANVKNYKHASAYNIAILDQNLRVTTGSDVTLGKTRTDAKLGGGGQSIHILHTDAGDYRVEAPVNKGLSIISALGSNAYRPAQIFHNKWFMDNVQPGTKVLFASGCARPSKKHPNETVRCTFWFPDPDSTDHEYAATGDFTPYIVGDGSNMQKTANTLCGTGKLRPDVEAELCGGGTPPPTP